VSIGSRVVPGTSETIIRSSPRTRLMNVDLPVFGRPTMATRGRQVRLGQLGQLLLGEVVLLRADAAASAAVGGGR
jgi:hypothetical protein